MAHYFIISPYGEAYPITQGTYEGLLRDADCPTGAEMLAGVRLLCYEPEPASGTLLLDGQAYPVTEIEIDLEPDEDEEKKY